MNDLDVRWKNRLSNYRRALTQLSAAADLAEIRQLSELERQGLIQAFEFTHELAWNVIKNYFAYQGNTAITGSRDAAQQPYGLPPHALEHLNAVFRKWPQIDRLILYGSRATGNFRARSDIDLCLEADSMQIQDLLKLSGEIDDLLLPWKVDLALKHTTENPDLLAHIERVGLPV